jgi:glycosyltransferase involved in cell wall biosynthesis
MPAISVIICTHNPRQDYLARVLDALKAQTLPKDQWELFLVDNASENPLAGRIDLSWHPNARHVREEKTGLTHARLCGIAAAQGELLVFVDDDNVLRADYLETCLKISSEHPRLGAWGGSCVAEFEVEPPAELHPWLGGLVTEQLKATVWVKLRRWTEASPAGAGLVLRQIQARHYRELALKDPMRQSLDRSGKNLGAGGDGDMVLCGFDLGLGAGRFPELELTHLIPAQRLTLEYIEGIHEGFGYGGVMLSAIHQPELLSGSSRWRFWYMWFLLRATGKSRVERRIRLAGEKGRLKAFKLLKQSGYFQKITSASAS